MINSKTIKRSKFIGLEGLNFIIKPLHTSLISLVVIRFFDLKVWGGFVIFLVGIDLLSSFLNWGQKPYLLRSFSLSPAKMNVQLGKALIARIPLLFISLLLIFILQVFRQHLIFIFLWLLFKWLAMFLEPVIQYHRKYWNAILAEICAISIAFAGIYYFRENFSESQLIIVFAASAFIRCLILFPLFRNIKFKGFKVEEIKKELQLALPFFGLAIAGLLQTKGDLFAVTYLSNEKALATYQVLISFLLIGQTLSWIVLGPFQKNIYRINNESLKKIKSTYLKVGVVLTSIMSLVIFLIVKEVYQLEFPYWYIVFFFIYLFPLYFYLIEAQILLKHNGERTLLKYNLIAAIVNIVLSLIFVSFYGIAGALASGIICRLVLAKLVINKSKNSVNVS